MKLARIDINFDGSVSVTNDLSMSRDARVPQDLFGRFFNTVAEARRTLDQRGIPWRQYHWNARHGTREFAVQSDLYPTFG